MICGSFRDWLEHLVRVQREGATYEVCDLARERLLGMRDLGTGQRVFVPLAQVIDRPNWGLVLPKPFQCLLNTPEGRKELAWVLSVGDHCLPF